MEWEGQEAYTGALPFTRLHSKHFFTPLLVLALPSVSLCIRFSLLCSLLRKCDSDEALLKSSFTTGPLTEGQSQQPVYKMTIFLCGLIEIFHYLFNTSSSGYALVERGCSMSTLTTCVNQQTFPPTTWQHPFCSVFRKPFY